MKKPEKIYCISVKTEVVRRNFMESELKAFFDGNTDYEFIDPVMWTDKRIDECKTQIIDVVGKGNIRASCQIAIAMSHYKVYYEIYKNKHKLAALIEDDIRIHPGYHKFLENLEISDEELETKPVLIRLCGGTYKRLSGLPTLVDNTGNVCCCFNIINYQYAKLFIENFYPISYQGDSYTLWLLRNFKQVRDYNVVPLMAWDFSSTIYSNLWFIEDRKLHHKINRLSTITKKLEKEDLCAKQNYNDKKRVHFLSPQENISAATDRTIIAGNGIDNLEETNSLHFIIIFVRGRLTYDFYVKNNAMITEQFAEPLLFYFMDGYLKKENILDRYEDYIFTLVENLKLGKNDEEILVPELDKFTDREKVKYDDFISGFKTDQSLDAPITYKNILEKIEFVKRKKLK